MLRPYGATGWGGLAAAIVGAGLRVAIVPLFVGPVLDRVMAQGDLAALPGVLATTGAAVVAMSLALLAQDALLAASGASLVARWRDRAYRALLRRTPGRLPGTSGGLAGRILSDVREVETYHQYGLGTLATETAAVVGIVGVLAWRAPLETAALAAFALPIGLLLGWLGRRLRGQADRAQAGSESVAAHLQEGLRQHATVRAYRAEPFLVGRFRAANDATRRAATRRGLFAAAQAPASQVAVFAALAGVVALLAGRAAGGAMTVGQVVEYLTLVALLSTPAQLLPRGYALLRQAEAAAARLRTLVADEAAVGAAVEAAAGADVQRGTGADPEPGGAAAGPPSGADAQARPREDAADAGLRLRDLWVRYDDGPWVLRGADARLPARGLAVLVGDSGAGKSTLLAALLGFVPAARGEIRVAGAQGAAAHERIAWVPQSLDLFRATVRENLTLGRTFSEPELFGALRAVRMEDPIRALPEGLDHPLDEDGAGLSGGQRQRLLVARALLSRPDVLLLDEPTANLDPEAEAELVTTVQREAASRLVLAVAHRTALADAADVLLRLDGGVVTELRRMGATR